MENAPTHAGIDGSAPDEQQHQADPVQQEALSPDMIPPPAMTLMPPEFVMPHTHLKLRQSMVRAAYPYPDPYFGNVVVAYGPQAMIHSHMLGIPHAGVALPSDANRGACLCQYKAISWNFAASASSSKGRV